MTSTVRFYNDCLVKMQRMLSGRTYALRSNLISTQLVDKLFIGDELIERLDINLLEMAKHPNKKVMSPAYVLRWATDHISPSQRPIFVKNIIPNLNSIPRIFDRDDLRKNGLTFYEEMNLAVTDFERILNSKNLALEILLVNPSLFVLYPYERKNLIAFFKDLKLDNRDYYKILKGAKISENTPHIIYFYSPGFKISFELDLNS